MNELQKEHIRKYGVNGEEVIRVVEAQEAELKKACRIMADLVTDYAYPYPDGTFGDGGMSSVSRAFHFLKEYGFAEITDEGTWRIHWQKLEEK